MKNQNSKLILSKQSIQKLDISGLSNLVGGAFPIFPIKTLSQCMSRGGEDGNVGCGTRQL